MVFEESGGSKGPARNESSDGGEGTQGRTGPIEVYPVGMFNKAPENDDPIFYQTATAADGQTTVGPFALTAQQIKGWVSKQTTTDLNDMVERGQLRLTTAMTVKSGQFDSILNLLASGQKLPPNMVQRFVPGDLQRVVHGTFSDATPRKK